MSSVNFTSLQTPESILPFLGRRVLLLIAPNAVGLPRTINHPDVMKLIEDGDRIVTYTSGGVAHETFILSVRMSDTLERLPSSARSALFKVNIGSLHIMFDGTSRQWIYPYMRNTQVAVAAMS